MEGLIFQTLACFIYSTSEISAMGRTEISIIECTDRKFCTPHYRNFCVKVDETCLLLKNLERKALSSIRLDYGVKELLHTFKCMYVDF